MSVSHLIVEKGPDRGREITIPPDGARIGRSSRNDITLLDPVMSRFHCRIFWLDPQTLAVADLGSSNQTLVNGHPVQEQPLKSGDRITIGDSVLKVVRAGEPVPGEISVSVDPPPAVSSAPLAAPVPAPHRSPLTFRIRRGLPPTLPPRRMILAGVALVMALIAASIWLFKIIQSDSPLKGSAAPGPRIAVPEPAFFLVYEKVEGSASNIFRYALSIRDGTATVQIDEILSARHVRREKRVDVSLLESLAQSVRAAGFFELPEDYLGVTPPNLFDSTTLLIAAGRDSRKIRVLNRVEPDAFKPIREMIEEFGRSELGLAALAMPPDRLRGEAQNAYLRGLKLAEEREVREDNLFKAIQAFQSAEWYLETLDPKPDYFADAITQRHACEHDLQERIANLDFLAERAIKLRDWTDAARQLRLICALMPDRMDDRNKRAMRKLLEVERHLKPNR
jgi:hypothetical protein